MFVTNSKRHGSKLSSPFKKGHQLNYLFFQLLLWPGIITQPLFSLFLFFFFLPLGIWIDNVLRWAQGRHQLRAWMDSNFLVMMLIFFSFLVFILIYCHFFLITPHSRHILPPPRLKIHMVNLFNLILTFRNDLKIYIYKQKMKWGLQINI